MSAIDHDGARTAAVNLGHPFVIGIVRFERCTQCLVLLVGGFVFDFHIDQATHRQDAKRSVVGVFGVIHSAQQPVALHVGVELLHKFVGDFIEFGVFQVVATAQLQEGGGQ